MPNKLLQFWQELKRRKVIHVITVYAGASFVVIELDEAIEQIKILLSHPGPYSASLLKLDPKWKPLWNHPEFIRLTEEYAVK